MWALDYVVEVAFSGFTLQFVLPILEGRNCNNLCTHLRTSTVVFLFFFFNSLRYKLGWCSYPVSWSSSLICQWSMNLAWNNYYCDVLLVIFYFHHSFYSHWSQFFSKEDLYLFLQLQLIPSYSYLYQYRLIDILYAHCVNI